MPKITYTAAKGLVQEAGSGISLQTDSVSLTSLPFSPVQAITAAATVTSPGVYTISGSAVLSVVMPTAATFPGSIFVFRCASAHAHILTGSAETVGFPAFAVSNSTSQGSKLTLRAGVGSSVFLVCDGNKFIVSANTGSITIAETIPA